MAGLDILGGIGAGLTKGTQAINEQRELAQRREEQNEVMRARQANLSMAQERHDWDRNDRAARQAATEQEQARALRVRQAHADEWAAAGDDPDPVAVNARIFKRMIGSGDLSEKDIEKLTPSVMRFREAGIMRALRSQDPALLQSSIESLYGAGASAQIKQGKDEWGGDSPVYTVFASDGRQLDSITAAGLGAALGVDELFDTREREKKARYEAARTEQARRRNDAVRRAGLKNLDVGRQAVANPNAAGPAGIPPATVRPAAAGMGKPRGAS